MPNPRMKQRRVVHKSTAGILKPIPEAVDLVGNPPPGLTTKTVAPLHQRVSANRRSRSRFLHHAQMTEIAGVHGGVGARTLPCMMRLALADRRLGHGGKSAQRRRDKRAHPRGILLSTLPQNVRMGERIDAPRPDGGDRLGDVVRR
jgi:hypothetical protein